MSEAPCTIADLLLRGAADHAALAAPDRTPLSYKALRELTARTTVALNPMGIGRNTPVAIVLPNGPEMAAAFVAVASGATAAPLNPAYREDEFEFYLSDLGARMLIVLSGMPSPARAVATRLEIPIVDLKADPQAGAGAFTLCPETPVETASQRIPDMAQPDDVALVLHTSGTTSRPKMVPLSHANVTASARHIGATLALCPADICLNIMPLFHIHGLMAAVLASLCAGATIYASPGFNALRFFGWLGESRATWYSAVPTMHQALLARAARNAEVIRQSRLRFIRSSSASLPPQVMAELEQVFQAPVIESYGMTEAAHQMASNPLPPRPRKPGSVGPAAGPELAIMDEAGQLLPAGATGEVVIRGPNVTRGYVGQPEANAKAFTSGWFRTGDQGRLDSDGYLCLTGRLKELINRGGEKISPLEVDAVLMDHPAVLQAISFAMPHEKLGEDVAAAIVLRQGQAATEREIKQFAAARMADFKIPRRIVFVDEIPKGPTGKLQRIGLAERLGLRA